MDLLDQLLKASNDYSSSMDFDSIVEDYMVEDAVASAELKAKHAAETEKLKDSQARDLESLTTRHEREVERQTDSDSKESDDDAIKSKRDADRKSNEKQSEGLLNFIDTWKQELDEVSASKRLTTRLKKSGVDLDKRAKDRAKEHAALVKKYGKREEVEVQERNSDVMKKRNQSQQKAHQKAMMKSAKKSIKDYDAKNKNKNEESEVEEGKLVTSAFDIIKLITKKVAERLDKEYNKNPEKGLGMINTIGAMVGHKVTDQAQEKGKLFLKFGESVEEDLINEEDPCWDSHKQVGMKKKNGKQVPNCVPKEDTDKVVCPECKGSGEVDDKECTHCDGSGYHMSEDRDYKKERENYLGKPEQMERNAARKRARRQMEKEGKAKAGDGKDVHHKDNNPLNNDKNNLSLVSQNYNRKEPRLRMKKLKEKGALPNVRK